MAFRVGLSVYLLCVLEISTVSAAPSATTTEVVELSVPGMSGNDSMGADDKTTTEEFGPLPWSSLPGNATADWSGNVTNDWSGNVTNDWPGNITSDWSGNATNDWLANFASGRSGNIINNWSGNITSDWSDNITSGWSGNVRSDWSENDGYKSTSDWPGHNTSDWFGNGISGWPKIDGGTPWLWPMTKEATPTLNDPKVPNDFLTASNQTETDSDNIIADSLLAPNTKGEFQDMTGLRNTVKMASESDTISFSSSTTSTSLHHQNSPVEISTTAATGVSASRNTGFPETPYASTTGTSPPPPPPPPTPPNTSPSPPSTLNETDTDPDTSQSLVTSSEMTTSSGVRERGSGMSPGHDVTPSGGVRGEEAIVPTSPADPSSSGSDVIGGSWTSEKPPFWTKSSAPSPLPPQAATSPSETADSMMISTSTTDAANQAASVTSEMTLTPDHDLTPLTPTTASFPFPSIFHPLTTTPSSPTTTNTPLMTTLTSSTVSSSSENVISTSPGQRPRSSVLYEVFRRPFLSRNGYFSANTVWTGSRGRESRLLKSFQRDRPIPPSLRGFVGRLQNQQPWQRHKTRGRQGSNFHSQRISTPVIPPPPQRLTNHRLLPTNHHTNHAFPPHSQANPHSPDVRVTSGAILNEAEENHNEVPTKNSATSPHSLNENRIMLSLSSTKSKTTSTTDAQKKRKGRPTQTTKSGDGLTVQEGPARADGFGDPQVVILQGPVPVESSRRRFYLSNFGRTRPWSSRGGLSLRRVVVG